MFRKESLISGTVISELQTSLNKIKHMNVNPENSSNEPNN